MKPNDHGNKKIGAKIYKNLSIKDSISKNILLLSAALVL